MYTLLYLFSLFAERSPDIQPIYRHPYLSYDCFTGCSFCHVCDSMESLLSAIVLISLHAGMCVHMFLHLCVCACTYTCMCIKLIIICFKIKE